MNDLSKRLGMSASSFRRFHPEICSKLFDYQKQFKDTWLKEMRNRLEASLNETPMPNLKEMEKRIGYSGEGDTLKKFFPDIHCEAIKCRKEKIHHESNELKQKLNQILDETPPPSMWSVYRRLGFNHSTLYEQHGVICRQIAERYTCYVSERSAEKRKQLYGEMQKIVLELHNQGSVPTAKRVHSYLPKNFISIQRDFF